MVKMTLFFSISELNNKFNQNELNNLTELIISDNQSIIEFPSEMISSLKNLKELTFYCDNLREFPKSIFTLNKLEKLEFNGIKIEYIPKEIYYLKNLKELKIDFSIINSFPNDIMFLENLKELSLIEDNIKIFPKEICKLINLEILNLLNNELREIPEEICKLVNLRKLDITDNELKYIPNEIKYLKNLKILLLLRNNNLHNIPTKVLGEMEKIKFLVVDEQLSIEKIIKKDFDSEDAFFTHYDLSGAIYHEKFFLNFEILNLSQHHLEELPIDIINMRNLIELDIHDDNLTYFPSIISNLFYIRRLYLYRNNFFNLSERIWNLPKLREVIVEGYLIPYNVLKKCLIKIKYIYMKKEHVLTLILKDKYKTPMSTSEIYFLIFKNNRDIFRVSLVNKTISPFLDV
ncbi:L domain-like protein [Neocallimastix lanati (nom. inval.)]|nr:L domain-like protein [Neocallimastix sp. JGI-2020a]